MKKILSAFVILLVLIAAVVSCKKNDPTSPATPTFTPTIVTTPDNSAYSFEDGTVMDWEKKLGGVTGVANSTVYAYRGSRSLRVDGNFLAANSNSAEVSPPVPSNLSGKKIIARIYIPSDFPTTGGCVYMQSGPSSCWEQGPWVNSFTKGGWTQIELEVDNPAGVYGSDPDHTNVSIVGITFNPGAAYSGSVYFDTIEIISAGTPTFTMTITETNTISPTATETITGTPPTETVTPTITQTPTLMSTPQAPNDPNIQYYGRWNFADPLVPKNRWGATYIVAGFEGTSVSIKLSAWDSWYGYAIDDFSDHAAFTKFRVDNGIKGTQPVQYVVSGLADTAHTIMVVRRTEGWGGIDSFYGFGLDTGKTLTAPPAAPARKIEIIGDSIVCGSAVEYVSAVPTATADLPCDYGACISNGDMTFGMQLARQYGAEGRTICRGGIGMYRNCSGCTPDYTMPQVYHYTYFEPAPSASSLTWNFNTWQTDIVVIALGTNDNPGPAESTAFKSAYSGFLTSLRTYYPNAYILCTEPIPLWMTTDCGTYISEVVTAFADAKVYYVPLRISSGLVAADFVPPPDNTHPVASGNIKVANALKTWIDANIMAGLVADHGW